MADESAAKKARTEGDDSYYRVIDGVKYDRALLEKVEAYAKDGQVSYVEAKKLWESAEDGQGVTDVEKQTVEYAMANYTFSAKAANYLKLLLKAGTFTSYYKIIDGVKYDRELLEKAELFAADGQISHPEAKELFDDANDGKGITDIEKTTLKRVMSELKLTGKAKAFLTTALGLDKHSYYKTVDGVRYDRELLEAAEAFAKDGQVSYPEAKRLWEDAQDGKGVTECEKVTLEYVLKSLKCSEKATNFLRTMLDAGKFTSYYQEIDGVKYDRELLERAKVLAADGQISVPDAKTLWEEAKDGKGPTEIEKATLQYALKTIKFTEQAAEFLSKELSA